MPTGPIASRPVNCRIPDLMVRFSFMDQTLGAAWAARFLGEFAEKMRDYIPSLKQYLESHAGEMLLSSRLALECGIQEYEARLRWARESVALYEQRKRNEA
jgi:hypothetical protein